MEETSLCRKVLNNIDMKQVCLTAVQWFSTYKTSPQFYEALADKKLLFFYFLYLLHFAFINSLLFVYSHYYNYYYILCQFINNFIVRNLLSIYLAIYLIIKIFQSQIVIINYQYLSFLWLVPDFFLNKVPSQLLRT